MKSKEKFIQTIKLRRVRRIRKKIHGTKERPRLSVFRSNKHIYAQLINDDEGKIIISASDLKEKLKGKNKTSIAKVLGKKLAEESKKKNIKSAVFDKRHYKYHGRIKAVADGAREGGLVI